MARKKYWNSEATNARWIKEGRGQGVGSNYKPWFSVRDVASEGRSHRVYGHLTNRTHHLLSDLELATFLLLQWRPTTTDIREQFPLDPTYTKQISVDAGITHPFHAGVIQYMSSDFVVNTKEEDRPVFALQVKPSSKLEDKRTVEKLEIERRYWLQKEIPWFLITEKQIPSAVFKNIEWLYSLQTENDDEADYKHLEQYSAWILQNTNLKIIDLCKDLDSSYSLPIGESLFQLRSLLAKRYFHFDIRIPYIELRCSDLISEPIEAIIGVSHVPN